MIANVVQQQWFVVRGWLDQEEWGDEPFDPDDVWAVGDRVQMKGFNYTGTVVKGDSAPFLGGYLPYIFVQWQHKSAPTPIAPEQLIRLTRFIPPELTWKAKDSFSDMKEQIILPETTPLKAISLRQPWASLIPLGLKHYETRSWKTNYRGKLLIYSTANNRVKQHQEYLRVQNTIELPPWNEKNFPCGYAMAVCDLVDCIEMTSEFIQLQQATEIACGDWQPGRYAWKLKNVQPLTPFPVKGKQGLFDVTEHNFSDECKKVLSVQLQQTNTINKVQSFSVGDLVSGSFGEGTILHIHGKKATVELRNYGRKEQIKLCHLTLIHETAVQLQQAQRTLKTKEEEAMVASFNLEATGFKPGQSVYVKKGNKKVKRIVGDRIGTGKNCGRVLTLGGRSGDEEYWEDPSKLEPIKNVETEQVSQPEKDLRVLVYKNLPDDDVWCSAFEMVQGLGYENTLPEIEQILEQLEGQGLAKRSLNTKNEVIWQKDVPNVNLQQQPQEAQETLREQESLPSTTFVAESVSVSCMQRQCSENLTSLEHVKSTTTVETSSASDTPVFQLQETSELQETLNELQQQLQAVRSLASHLASQESDLQPTMSEISSPTGSNESIQSTQDTSSWKMSQESCQPPTNQENPLEHSLDGYSGSFPTGGIMFNGKFSAQDTLDLPSPESGLFWLRSPQALSSSSEETRPPGQSKLEVQLRELGLLGPQEVLNPEFLAKGLYNLPANWASQSESRAAIEILGISAKPTEMLLIPDQLPLPSATSSELKQQELNLKNKKQVEAVPIAQATVQKTITGLNQICEGLHWIDPNLITLDGGTQSRVETDKPTVKYYAEQMKSDLWEWEASPVGLLWDGEALLPWDGHHRIEAAIAAGKNILARIQTGDLRRAIALSCGSNKKPSLRRTREDNQKTIEMLEDLRKQHGDEWLLQIINAELPTDKQFKEVSLRAIESYTGIPFSTIRNVQKRKDKDKDKEKTEKIAFTPTPDEMQLIESIMEAEELDKPSEVIRWLLQNYQES